MTRKIVNFVAFYAGWYFCVRFHDARSLAVVGAAVALHLWLSRTRRADLRTLGWTVVIGFIADSLLEASGLVRYAGGPRFLVLCPLWIAALWALFATTLNSSLGWLQRRPAAGALLGAIGGPLTYFSASHLGAVDVGTPGLVAVGIEYALLVPVLMIVAHGTGRPVAVPQRGAA